LRFKQLFRKNIAKLVNNLWKKIFGDAEEATTGNAPANGGGNADWNQTDFK
jgi:hypothetical protein